VHVGFLKSAENFAFFIVFRGGGVKKNFFDPSGALSIKTIFLAFSPVFICFIQFFLFFCFVYTV
jgi:hypothetical protein